MPISNLERENTIFIVVVAVDLSFTTLLTFQVISVAFYIEREKSDKFSTEALISCPKSTTRDQRLYFPFEGSHTQNFYALKKSIDPTGFELGISDPVANMITTGPPESTYL